MRLRIETERPAAKDEMLTWPMLGATTGAVLRVRSFGVRGVDLRVAVDGHAVVDE